MMIFRCLSQNVCRFMLLMVVQLKVKERLIKFTEFQLCSISLMPRCFMDSSISWFAVRPLSSSSTNTTGWNYERCIHPWHDSLCYFEHDWMHIIKLIFLWNRSRLCSVFPLFFSFHTSSMLKCKFDFGSSLSFFIFLQLLFHNFPRSSEHSPISPLDNKRYSHLRKLTGKVSLSYFSCRRKFEIL